MIEVFFSEEMVGWGLRSSEPCGCTLTLRDRFFLAFGPRKSRGRKVGAARERGKGGVPGARCGREMGSLRTAMISYICRGNVLEKGENSKKM